MMMNVDSFGPYAPPQTPAYPSYGPPPGLQKKHSGFGIASFVIALLTGAVEFFATFIVAFIAAANGQPEIADDDPMALGLGLLICSGLFVHVLGIVFGIVGLTAGDKKRVLAGVGLGLNGFFAFGVLVLIVIGNLS